MTRRHVRIWLSALLRMGRVGVRMIRISLAAHDALFYKADVKRKDACQRCEKEKGYGVVKSGRLGMMERVHVV